MQNHYAEYGNTRLIRNKCPACKRFAFVIDGRYQCCDRETSAEPQFIKKMVIASPYRKIPTTKKQREILEKQQNKCLYCEVEFGSVVFRNEKPLLSKLEWDHQVPFVYSQNNNRANFCAACNICNRIKSSKMFQTVDEAIIYIRHKRNLKGYAV